MWSTVIFDFDQTIADTSRLMGLREEARRTRDWKRYSDSMHKAPPVTLGRNGTALDLLRTTVEAGLKTVIASRSAGGPIKRWLSHFADDLDLEVFPTIGADRSGLERIASTFARRNRGVVFVDDEYSGVKAAHDLGWLTATTQVRVSASHPPDMWLLDPDALTDVRKPGRLIGEYTDSLNPGILYVGPNQMVIGGNYFSKTHWDRKHGGHDLTQRILKSKNGWPWHKDLRMLVDELVEAAIILSGDRHVILTGIPPRSDHEDRFRHVLPDAAKRLNIPYVPVLDFQREVQQQIGLSPSGRKSNLDNSMTCESVDSATVIVFDDVTTSGATLGEASRALRAAGATRVVPVALAKTAGYRGEPIASFTLLSTLRAKRPDWLSAQIAPPQPERPRERRRSHATHPHPQPIKIPDDYVTASDIRHRSTRVHPQPLSTMIELSFELVTDEENAADFLFANSEAEMLSMPGNLYRSIGSPDAITAQLAIQGHKWQMDPSKAVFPIGWLIEEESVLKPTPESGHQLELLVLPTTMAKLRTFGRAKLRLVC